MGGDYSRDSFSALKDFAGIRMQQGHPTLDADWNEFVQIVERRMRAQTVDVMGRAVVPRETPSGFEIRMAGNAMTIGRGRMYVDGLLAENHGRQVGPDQSVLDRSRIENGLPVGVLDEPISLPANDFIDYRNQPYLPNPPALPKTPGPHIVYLDVFQREVTPLHDPGLLEPALGGIDTATRMQTAWQVKVLDEVGAGVDCDSRGVAKWDALIRPSGIRLTTATVEFEDPDEPCTVPPGGGYRGPENQNYRIEIHSGGALGTARFKWSRDNASVGATVENINNVSLSLKRIGRDSELRFRTGDWVEITDDQRELAGLPGDIRKATVNEDSNELRVDQPLSADLIPAGGADTVATRHTRVIRWDQRGLVRHADGTELVDLDSPLHQGLIPVPADGRAVLLEAGVTVTFSMEPGGVAKSQDYWSFVARTGGVPLEKLDRAFPRGVRHCYARLAMWTLPNATLDCRQLWPSQGDDDCCCTVCVTAEQHESGELTLYEAVDRLPPEGGTICLGLGDFVLGERTVEIIKRRSVRMRGHGPATTLIFAGKGAAITVQDSADIAISDLCIFLATGQEGEDARIIGLHADNTERLSLKRTTVELKGAVETIGIGVLLQRNVLQLDISECLIRTTDAIRAAGDPARNEFCIIYDASVAHNEIRADRRGIELSGNVVHVGLLRIADNLVAAGNACIAATGACFSPERGTELAEVGAGVHLGGGSVVIEGNSLLFGAMGWTGIGAGTHRVAIRNNVIACFGPTSGTERSCIQLVESFFELSRDDLARDIRIEGNRLAWAPGVGIDIIASQRTLSIVGNHIHDCVQGGVLTPKGALIETLEFRDNIVEQIAGPGPERRTTGAQFGAVLDGRFVGNTIRQVGLLISEDDQLFSGLVVGAGLVTEVSGNSFSQIGALARGASRVEVLRLTGPFATVDVSHNRINGNEARDGGHWTGIGINCDTQMGITSGSFLGEGVIDHVAPVFVMVGDKIIQLHDQGMLTFAIADGVQVNLADNMVWDARNGSKLPMISVVTNEKQSTITFSGNQCRNTRAVSSSVVVLDAARVAVANNVVRHDQDNDAIEINADNEPPWATAVGNITMGNIRINSRPLSDFPNNCAANILA